MCKKSIYLMSLFLLMGLISAVANAKDPFLQSGEDDGIVAIEAENYDVNEYFGKIYKEVEPTVWEWVGPHIWQEVINVRPYDPNDEPNGIFITNPGMQSLPSGAGPNGISFKHDAEPYYDTNAPRLDYKITFVKLGTHYIHVRGWGDNGNSNTIWVGIDGAPDKGHLQAAGRMQFAHDNNEDDDPNTPEIEGQEVYGWDNDYSDLPPFPGGMASFDIGELGLHTLNIWARETGLVIDTIVITTNPDYDPNEVNDGNGPPESPRRDPACAYNPSPYDGEQDVLQKVALTWLPGSYVDGSPKHRIYFSDDYDDVNGTDDPVVASQDPCRYPTVGTLNLDWEKTYYWRVDESNDPATLPNPPGGWDIGYIWQFTVEPNCWPLASEHVVGATAYSSLPNQGPEKTKDGSGLIGDIHSTTPTDMWLSSTAATPRWIIYEFDRPYKLNAMKVWNYNGIAPANNNGLQNVDILYSTNGSSYTLLTNTNFNKAPGSPTLPNNTINFKEVVAKYVKITAYTNYGGGNNYGLSEVRFYYIPLRATRPQPPDGATEKDPRSVVLTWRHGREAAQHKVYISDDEQAVINGTALVATVNEPSTSYDTSSLNLDLGKTYYWKINEVNNAENPNTWEGDVWQFDTINYLVVDDMDEYGDLGGASWVPPWNPGERIYYVWRDGWAITGHPELPDNDTGSQSYHWNGYNTGFSETETARSRKSMPLYYENDGSVKSKPDTGFTNAGLKYYSEASAKTTGDNSLNFMTDWVKNGAQALSLWFFGNPDNATGTYERMYVALQDGAGHAKAVYYDVANGYDPEEVKNPTWHEWVILLSKFDDANPALDVNLADVRKIHIGFGIRGNVTNKGTSCSAPYWFFVYIDDIRLYSSWCVPSLRQPDADLDNDCDVDYDDLAVMGRDWLAEDYNGTGELILRWKFDETSGTVANDDSIYNHDGDVNGATINQTGQVGKCYLFGGDGDNVVVQNVDDTNDWMDGLYGLSVCLWVKATQLTDRGFIIFDSMGDFTHGDQRNMRCDLEGTNGLANVITCGVTATGGFQQVESSADWQSPVNTWRHVAITWTTGEPVKLYIDGVFIYTFTNQSPPWGTTTGYNAVIVGKGKEDDAVSEGWLGNIDDVQIYNYELSPAEVALVKLGNAIPKKDPLYYPPPSPAELYGGENQGLRKINFRDYAVLAADRWLEEPLLWP